MKNTFVSTLQRSFLSGVFAIGVLTSASSAFAQGRAVMVNVPFDFQNGARHFHAGIYRIDLQPGHTMHLSDATSGQSAFGMAIPELSANAPAKGKVVFQRYAGHSYIREIWVPGETIGYFCPKSREEKEDQKLMIAKNSQAPANVEVALNAHR